MSDDDALSLAARRLRRYRLEEDGRALAERRWRGGGSDGAPSGAAVVAVCALVLAFMAASNGKRDNDSLAD